MQGEDFDDAMIERVKKFLATEKLDGSAAGIGPTVEQAILSLQESRREESLYLHFPWNQIKTPQNDSTFQVLSMDPQKLAQMITLVDYRLYEKIRVRHQVDFFALSHRKAAFGALAECLVHSQAQAPLS